MPSGSDHPLIQFRGPKAVPVQIQPSVLVLALIFLFLTGSFNDIHFDTVYFLLLVGSLLLHEVGHAWACHVQGLRVRRIVVHGGGGSCEHFGHATREQQELIALMGMIVNLGIWAVASLIYPLLEPGLLQWMVYALARINLFLAVLNLLPMNPLDGGKLFQLILARILPQESVLRLAGICGVVVAMLWIPTMILCFLSYGLVLFLLPSVSAHWRMARI